MDNYAKLAILLETKVKVENCATTFDSFLSNWRYLHNGAADSTVRIWLGWDATVFRVEEIEKSSQFIHAKVTTLGTSLSFLLRIGGDPIRQEATEDLTSFIYDSDLVDLKWKGELFTWNNRQEGSSRVCCKLDRALVNLHWMDTLRSSEATFLPPGLSDHSLAVVSILGRMNFGPKLFRFFEAWIGREGFEEVVTRGQERHAELTHIQVNLTAQPNDSNLVNLESEAKKKLWEALSIEEKFLKEKSRVRNIQLGDGNNSFFHKSTVCRQNRNHILEVHNEENEVIKEPNLIKEEAVSFYMNLFGANANDAGFFPESIPLQNGLNLEQQNGLIG
ncbi:uncharacterized protein LOC122647825 [Telopea speciosissima]|uniref:uncharacterized protein LOC122647825 n=1 Tax=Telopea speciosissima TaxID=54955 RepID=UPI001CC7D66E|nr:uncharacterized protein LOC122647825 [Telopea speciosissima]